MATTTSTVYVNVIEDVIDKVRDEFLNNGPGEDVLKELQGMWEAKMMQAGVVNAPIERSAGQKPTPGGPITPVHDLNVPYEGTEEYETPTAEMLFPPTPLQTPIQTPLPGTGDNLYNIPTGPNDYAASGNDTGGRGAVGVGNSEMKIGRPSPYMQPPSPWMTQRPSLDVNIAYVEGRDEVNRGASHQPPTQDFFMASSGKRKRDEFASQYQTGDFIPQQDGAGDATPEVFEIELSGGSTSLGGDTRSALLARIVRTSSKIPQVDGPIPDPYDDVLSTPNIYNYQGVFNEDYNVANTPAPNDVPASTPAIPVPNDIGDDDDDEPPLNENDDDEPPLNENDDDELDDVDPGEELNTQHLVLAQFDKVTRTKSKWKCILKDGIMHISDKDVLFNKATGEFDF